jgi:hypothetical protein
MDFFLFIPRQLVIKMEQIGNRGSPEEEARVRTKNGKFIPVCGIARLKMERREEGDALIRACIS